MDEAAIRKSADQAATMVKEMQDRIRKMPAEQRSMMERSMGAQMPGVFGKKDTFEWKDTGKSDSVDGRQCRVWNLLKNDRVSEEHCLVPYGSLPGNEDVAKANRDLWNSFVAGTAGLISVADYAEARQSSDGYAVRIRSFDSEGNLNPTEIVLARWVEEALPASTFEIPAGYKKVTPPKPGS